MRKNIVKKNGLTDIGELNYNKRAYYIQLEEITTKERGRGCRSFSKVKISIIETPWYYLFK